MLKQILRLATVWHKDVLHHEHRDDLAVWVDAAVRRKRAAMPKASHRQLRVHALFIDIALPAAGVGELFTASGDGRGEFTDRFFAENSHSIELTAIRDHGIETPHIGGGGK